MRKPKRKLWIGLAIALAGVVLAYLGASGHERDGERAIWITLLLVGLLSTPIALGMSLYAALHIVGIARLKRGDGLLAKWSLTASEWDTFRKLDEARSASDFRLTNELSLGRKPQHESVDVLVGKTSALIGDSYHVLRKWGIPGIYAVDLVPLNPAIDAIEFRISYPRRGVAPLQISLRIPFPVRFQAEGQKVHRHFAPMLVPKTAIALRNPKYTIRAASVVAVICGTAFAWGIWRATTGHDDEIAAQIAALVGGLVGLSALILAIAAFAMSRRRAP